MITLQEILNTLNQIEVKGKDNLDRLLGAIMALEILIESQKSKGEEENREGGE